MTKPYVHALIPFDLSRWLERYREERGLTTTAVLTEALERLRAEEPTEPLAAVRADLTRALQRLQEVEQEHLTSPPVRAIDGARPKASTMTAKTKKPVAPAKKQGVSMRAALAQVLAEGDGPRKVKDLTETLLERKLISTKGKTPAATAQAVMLRSPEFVHVAPGTYDLRDLNPRGATQRPKQK
jgi:HB1, ASXL, restriction endonuclease HTH domain